MKNVESIYFERYAWPIANFKVEYASIDADIIVVIPAFKESSLEEAIHSLLRCTKPESKVAIFVIVNEPDTADAFIREVNDEAEATVKSISASNPAFPIHCVRVALPAKKAGVGLARKIGMDDAARCFSFHQKSGIIVCFDGDCSADPDYLTSIEDFYYRSDFDAGLMYYEHPLTKENGILQYELFLRYYADSLRYAGYPLAFQTLGSCITVKSDVYIKHGGMNKRKAGEDFYFLHKILPHVNAGDITDTTIHPSARLSDRVPFGTGRALNAYDPAQTYRVYDPECFDLVSVLLDHQKSLYTESRLPDERLESWIENSGFNERITHLRENTSDLTSFKSKFFQVFDGFQVLKLIHFIRDRYLEPIELESALSQINRKLWQIDNFDNLSLTDKLQAIRKWDRSNPLSYKVK